MQTDEDRRYILYEFLRTIWGISDIEYQKRVWIRGEGPECDDFDETVCYFFDICDFILNKYPEYGITEKQYELLKEFKNDFRFFEENNFLPQKFIDTHEWKEIMEKAKTVLKAFNFVKKPYSSRPQKLDD
jgi:hypothetical protein